MSTNIKKIISGGQTGADRAGLEAGRVLGLQTGGWVPKGWRVDGGSDPSLADFGLKEHPSTDYPPRTHLNVASADATVLFGNMHSPGCALTIRCCRELGKPYQCNPTAFDLRTWLVGIGARVLNVAGNRERTNPGIAAKTLAVLLEALS